MKQKRRPNPVSFLQVRHRRSLLRLLLCLTCKTQEKPQEAEVIAVGPGGLVDGKEVTMQVKVGDKVIYSKYSGNEVKLGEEEYIIVKQSDILAVVE